MAGLSTKLDLYFQAHRLANKDLLSKSDPYVILYHAKPETSNPQRAKLAEVGRTERIKNSLDPHFTTAIEVDYFFEQRQNFALLMYDDDGKGPGRDDYLGGVVFQLAQVVGRQGATAEFPLEKKGKVTVTATARHTHVRDQVELQFAGTKLKKMDLFGKSDPFFHLCRKTPHGKLEVLYKSSVCKKTLNPEWPAFKFPVQKLLGVSSADNVITFQCFDKDRNGSDSMGEFTCSFDDLSRAAQSRYGFTLVDGQKKKKQYGTIVVKRHVIHRVPPFLELLQRGLQLSVAFSIDFTGSNGNPIRPTSLHYMAGSQPNDYVRAIHAIGNIVMPYDADGQVAAFGFGAKLPGHGTSHCFPLNFTASPYMMGIHGLMQAYADALTKVQLSGPTNFAPTIEAVTQGARQMPNTYTILVILTDGEITDMDKTIDAIVAATESGTPLSIIIIGVGHGCSFKMMERLDADDEPLRNSQGRKASRDIVQFVPFRRYEQQPPEALAAEVLREVPRQVEDWAMATGFGKTVGR